MAEDKDERQNYEEKLQVILHTCLLYNTSEAMGKAANYKLQGEGNKGFKGKPLPQLKILYKGFRAEAFDNTRKEVDLDELLNDYKTVSEYWKKWLKRSYSIDLHNYDESKKEIFICVLRLYLCLRRRVAIETGNLFKQKEDQIFC